jgi:hypothetical protein
MTMVKSFFYCDVETASFSETSVTINVTYSGSYRRYGRNCWFLSNDSYIIFYVFIYIFIQN